MREFIITNPNLSVGRPGDIVTADQLRMTDDKLDEWVAAGFGMEVGGISDPIAWADDLPVEEPDDEPADAASGLQGIEGDPDEYDPEDHTVSEVTAYMDDFPERAYDVWQLEAAGKARSGILNHRVD